MKYICSLLAIMMVFGCKKSEPLRPISSITFVNAAIGTKTVKAYANDTLISWRILPTSDQANYCEWFTAGAWAGQNIIRSVVGEDTTINIFSPEKRYDFRTDGLKTLFFCGQKGSYEGVFIENDNHYYYTDSVLGIRFINLSPNCEPLNVSLAGSPDQWEVSQLAYKQYTPFKTYPARWNTPNMIFRFKNAAGTLLATDTIPHLVGAPPPGTINPYQFASLTFGSRKNITLVVKGLQGTTTGKDSLGVFPVTHYSYK